MKRQQENGNLNPRYPKLLLTGTSINYLRWNNVYMTVWWGLSFPGFGQWYQGRYFYGLVLIVWEFFINVMAHLNTAIYYTMAGRFKEAGDVLDQRWFLMYIAIYIFAVWDSYFTGVELNRRGAVAEHEPQSLKSFSLNSLSVDFLMFRDPRLGIIWSLLVPGAGHFWLQRKVLAVFFFVCWMMTVYMSGLPQGVLATFLGDAGGIGRAFDPQWFLFIPSLYMFACYDTYVSTCRLNELFMEEQEKYLTVSWGRASTGKIAFPKAKEGGGT
ncbi:hypothetical protein ACFFK0_29380 [Paenibacillus chartarius]|uniref:Uncharacterized protein n=1 Tax=Paenibacillus chartarius TaxID=747481 RepID=A0ABV6DV34_9BACL